MPHALVNKVMVVLRAAIIIIVFGWILNIPGELQIGLFTEQMLVTVLGLSLALTFLTFPLSSGEVGEEAVVRKVLGHQRYDVGLLDALLAVAALVSCFYIAIRYPELQRELVMRPWYGVLVASVV